MKNSHTSKQKGGPHKGDWHTSHTSMGMGDYYGTGIKAKLGKMREGTGMVTMDKQRLGTPPKSVV
jgi:hypothetical protein